MKYRIRRKVTTTIFGDHSVLWVVQKRFLLFYWRTIYTSGSQNISKKFYDAVAKDPALVVKPGIDQ